MSLNPSERDGRLGPSATCPSGFRSAFRETSDRVGHKPDCRSGDRPLVPSESGRDAIAMRRGGHTQPPHDARTAHSRMGFDRRSIPSIRRSDRRSSRTSLQEVGQVIRSRMDDCRTWLANGSMLLWGPGIPAHMSGIESGRPACRASPNCKA